MILSESQLVPEYYHSYNLTALDFPVFGMPVMYALTFAQNWFAVFSLCSTLMEGALPNRQAGMTRLLPLLSIIATASFDAATAAERES